MPLLLVPGTGCKIAASIICCISSSAICSGLYFRILLLLAITCRVSFIQPNLQLLIIKFLIFLIIPIVYISDDWTQQKNTFVHLIHRKSLSINLKLLPRPLPNLGFYFYPPDCNRTFSSERKKANRKWNERARYCSKEIRSIAHRFRHPFFSQARTGVYD